MDDEDGDKGPPLGAFSNLKSFAKCSEGVNGDSNINLCSKKIYKNKEMFDHTKKCSSKREKVK